LCQQITNGKFEILRCPVFSGPHVGRQFVTVNLLRADDITWPVILAHGTPSARSSYITKKNVSLQKNVWAPGAVIRTTLIKFTVSAVHKKNAKLILLIQFF